jgi:DNA-binding IclR family transcriptional regulator
MAATRHKPLPPDPAEAAVAHPAPEPDYAIASAGRCLSIMETMARLGPVALMELARATGMPAPATFRMLRTLAARGFVMQEGARGPWTLGPAAFAFGQIAAAPPTLGRIARPLLEELVGKTLNTAYLGVREGLEMRVVTLQEPARPARRYAEADSVLPLHAGPGRMLLAHAPPALVARLFALRPPRYTPATRIEAAWFPPELARIRARGWLVTAQELTEGGTAVTVPVRGPDGHVLAALWIAAPLTRLARPQAMVEPLREAAAALANRLGAP